MVYMRTNETQGLSFWAWLPTNHPEISLDSFNQLDQETRQHLAKEYDAYVHGLTGKARMDLT